MILVVKEGTKMTFWKNIEVFGLPQFIPAQILLCVTCEMYVEVKRRDNAKTPNSILNASLLKEI